MEELEDYQLVNMRILCLEEEMNRLARQGVSLDDPVYQVVNDEWKALVKHEV